MINKFGKFILYTHLEIENMYLPIQVSVKTGGYVNSPRKYGRGPEEGQWKWIQKEMHVREISEGGTARTYQMQKNNGFKRTRF